MPTRTATEIDADGDYPAVAWRTTIGLAVGVGLGAGLMALAVVSRRADIALLGLPALLSAAWGWTHRPAERVRATLTPEEAPAGTVVARLRASVPAGAEVVHVRVSRSGELGTEILLEGAPGREAREREITLSTPSVRTGLQDTFRVDYAAYGPEGIEEQTPELLRGPARLVLPGMDRLGRIPVHSLLRGLTGPRTSRRMGDGSELRDIDTFRPGDRPRRIDWRSTARRSPTLDTLYVRRTFAVAEATVVLVVDSRDDVGPDLTTWGGTGYLRPDEPTSLDITRHAAASVARAVVDAGDRVGLEDLGRQRRPVLAGGGTRHLRRIIHGLALASPVGEPTARQRPPQVPTGAAIYLFSTFLDDETPRLAHLWHESGHAVVAVDTLPSVSTASAEHRVVLAWRITRMEREDRLRALRAEGITVVRWAPDTGTSVTPQTALEVAARRQAQQRATGAHRPGISA